MSQRQTGERLGIPYKRIHEFFKRHNRTQRKISAGEGLKRKGLVLNTIREAKKKEKVTSELQLHSDQGFQYTSTAYYRLTQSYGVSVFN